MSQVLPPILGEKVIIAVGSNAPSRAGDARSTVLAAVDELRSFFENLQVSRLYQTPAFPAGSGPDFINAVCTGVSKLPAEEVLQALHSIEADFGREREVRWGQRTLDLDIIVFGDVVLPDAETFNYWRNLPIEDQKEQVPGALILPHPRVQDRAFVLVPMMDVAPDWMHPVLGLTTAEMLSQLPASERDEILAL